MFMVGCAPCLLLQTRAKDTVWGASSVDWLAWPFLWTKSTPSKTWVSSFGCCGRGGELVCLKIAVPDQLGNLARYGGRGQVGVVGESLGVTGLCVHWLQVLLGIYLCSGLCTPSGQLIFFYPHFPSAFFNSFSLDFK